MPSRFVIPAKAGIQSLWKLFWIPAYAGKTQKETFQRTKVFPILVKKSFRRITFVKDLPIAEVNMPMDDQV